MADTYWTEEISAIPFGTLIKALSPQISAPMAVPIAAFFRLRGLLNWPLRPMYAAGEFGSEQVVQREEIPGRALGKWAPICERLSDLGFRPLRYIIPDLIGEKQGAASIWLDAAGSTLATFEWLRQRGAQGLEERTPLEFNSYADEDPELLTGRIAKKDMALVELLKLPHVQTIMFPEDLSIDQVYQNHLSRLDHRAFYAMTPEAALQVHQERTKKRWQWVVDRGYLRQLRPHEVTQLKEAQPHPDWISAI